jgi:hypothetical protein
MKEKSNSIFTGVPPVRPHGFIVTKNMVGCIWVFGYLGIYV